MNNEQIFQLGLGLVEPWYVAKAELVRGEASKELHLYLVGEDGKVKQVEVPWAREGSGFTLLFEAFAMLLIEQEMPVNKVGKTVSTYPKRIWTIFNHWLSKAYAKADHAGIEVLGIDETSSKRGHDYVTLAVDMKTSRPVHRRG